MSIEVIDSTLLQDATLKGYWRLSDVNDSSGVGLTLTNNGTATFVAGKFGNCVNLVGGSSQYLSASGDALFSTGSQTWSCWVNLVDPVYQTNGYIWILTDGTSVLGLRLAEAAAQSVPYDLAFTVSGLTGTSQVNAIISANTWYHVVCVFDTDTTKRYLYVNGVELLSGSGAAYTGTITDQGTVTFKVGRAIASFISGKVDDLAVWHRALSSTEVLNLYKNYGMAAAAGSFALTSVDTTLTKALNMAADAGSFVLTGIDVALQRGYSLVADVGTFTLTGIDAVFTRGYTLAADAGSFILTGIDALFNVALSMSASVGSFVLTMKNITVNRTLGVWSTLDKPTTSWNSTSKPTTLWTNIDRP